MGLKVNIIMKHKLSEIKNYHTSVLGTGAVGTAVASCLSRISECMQFDSKGVINQNNHHILINRNGVSYPINCYEFDFSTLDCVFVCTKIYQITEVIKQYIENIPEYCPIILVCNGYVLDILENLNSLYPLHHFRLSYTDVGVSKIEDRTYKINSLDSSFIWGTCDEVNTHNFHPIAPLPFETLLSNYKDTFTNINFTFSDSCIEQNCQKWIFNTCLNSLCVYRGCNINSEVLKYQTDLKQIFDETFELSKLIFKSSKINLNHSSLFQKLLSLIERTASNRNSMVSDVLEKRMTENEYLSGMSQRYSQNFPFLTKVYSFIKEIDLKLKNKV